MSGCGLLRLRLLQAARDRGAAGVRPHEARVINMRNRTLPILVAVLVSNVGLWAWMNQPADEVDFDGVVRGVSFSPYRADQDPLQERFPTAADIEEDIQILASRVGRIRTYSSVDGIEQVPPIAKKYGIKVTAGAWLDTRKDRNKKELRNLVRSARRNANIERLIVGNETVLRGDFRPAELAKVLRRIRAQVKQPVSTAEPWHVWIRYPQLAAEVDFIAAHILPYWEGVPAEQGLQFTLSRYEQLREAFPDKPILIAEVGWPSHGNRREAAVASQTNQARFMRRFLNAAERRGLDYFVMEAFDQPWKRPIEGTVGAYWGLLDLHRTPKFAMSGPVTENPWWPVQTAIAALFALLPMAWFVASRKELRSQGRLFYAFLIQLAASVATWAAFVPFTEYMSAVSTAMWSLLLPAQLLILLVMLVNGFELAEMTWTRGLRRQFRALPPDSTHSSPKVSVHLAICNEPPHLVIETLDSLARLDYADFEVLVIDNNTRDAACWEPVQAHCQKLGERFRFFTLGQWPGFKAGALNFGLQRTAPDAEVIAVVDADYVVERDWLKRLAPYFADPAIGFVQAPQDHRDWHGDRFQEVCNFEYTGFFHIGMVHRNERDAIIQHGTMTMIRRAALDRLGGWAEWCICEDAELGLRLLEAGYQSVYVNHAFGRGLTAQTFAGYKSQRYRWAYGAVQIVKRHWRELVPWGGGRLRAGQRYHFLTGWAPWFADALQLLFTVTALFWTIGLLGAPRKFEFPITEFLVPTIGMFAFKMMHSLWLYTTRVPSTWSQRLGAAVAAMALTHSIARAMFRGIFTTNAPFMRTPKAEDRPALVRAIMAAREESLILFALWVAAIAIAGRYGIGYTETQLWVAVLMVQSVPYMAALYLSILNTRPVVHVPALESRAVATQPLTAQELDSPDRQAA
jgi:exo-beta-1,3-glucanase (GH17 family)/cellulose synthase/poly-beta-1,6-N-acetylglucosamine synthase-like glycosyltransferase